MYPDSRQTIHMGINFIVSPVPTVDKKVKRKFDQALDEEGLEFTQVQISDREIVTFLSN